MGNKAEWRANPEGFKLGSSVGRQGGEGKVAEWIACLRDPECQEEKGALPLTSQQASHPAESFTSLGAAFDIHCNRILTDKQRLWGAPRPEFQHLII